MSSMRYVAGLGQRSCLRLYGAGRRRGAGREVRGRGRRGGLRSAADTSLCDAAGAGFRGRWDRGGGGTWPGGGVGVRGSSRARSPAGGRGPGPAAVGGRGAVRAGDAERSGLGALGAPGTLRTLGIYRAGRGPALAHSAVRRRTGAAARSPCPPVRGGERRGGRGGRRGAGGGAARARQAAAGPVAAGRADPCGDRRVRLRHGAAEVDACGFPVTLRASVRVGFPAAVTQGEPLPVPVTHSLGQATAHPAAEPLDGTGNGFGGAVGTEVRGRTAPRRRGP